MILTALVLVAQCYAQPQSQPGAEVKTLVVYYSYSGVTTTLAQAIASDCNATLLQVVDHGNYPRPESSTTYNYANNERSQIDAGVWPTIQTIVEDFDQWDAIIICTPLWNGKMANPMLTFLHNHASKLAGKQVALAVTSWSSGISGVVTDAHNQLPGCTFVGNALHINYNNRGNISTLAANWVSTLQFQVEQQPTGQQVRVLVGDKTFMATLADNETAVAFKALLPLTLNMTELNGNEKYNYLSTSLPRNASNPGTIHAGDIMLYGSSCVVLFYGTFNTSYSYTRIGAIDDPDGLSQALGAGDVVVTFELVASATPLLGDVDGDNEIGIGDVTALIDIILSGRPGGFSPDEITVADIDKDNEITVSDVTALINIILS